MGKKKSKKRVLALPHTAHPGPASAQPAGAPSDSHPEGNVTAPDLSGIERLLPRLILFPSERHRLPASDRRALERSVRLCEDMLALKPEIERVTHLASLVQVTGSSIEAGAASTPNAGTLAAAVEETASPAAARSAIEEALHRRRLAAARAFERAIPKDLQEWISGWDRKIDAQVGEEYVRWLAEGSALLQAQAREWVDAVARVSPGSLGLASRLRALRLSGRARAAMRETARLRHETALRRARLAQVHARTARLCGILAAFLKTTSCAPSGDARLVRKLLLLDLERKLSADILGEIASREKALAEGRAARDRSERRHASLRRYVTELEGRKNLRLVELFAASGANVKEAIPAATVRQIDAAFAEIRAAEDAWRDAAAREGMRVAKLKRELERLSGVLDDYARRYFADGLRGPGDDLDAGTARPPEGPGAPVVRLARLAGRAQ